jgi:hypothetical protein
MHHPANGIPQTIIRDMHTLSQVYSHRDIRIGIRPHFDTNTVDCSTLAMRPFHTNNNHPTAMQPPLARQSTWIDRAPLAISAWPPVIIRIKNQVSRRRQQANQQRPCCKLDAFLHRFVSTFVHRSHSSPNSILLTQTIQAPMRCYMISMSAGPPPLTSTRIDTPSHRLVSVSIIAGVSSNVDVASRFFSSFAWCVHRAQSTSSKIIYYTLPHSAMVGTLGREDPSAWIFSHKRPRETCRHVCVTCVDRGTERTSRSIEARRVRRH